MIFKQVSEIVQGQKTQTRRVCKPSEYLRRGLDGSNVQVRVYDFDTGQSRLKWLVGRDYAVVPKRGASTYVHEGQSLRIEIVGIRQEPLQAISEADALAEGIQHVTRLGAAWPGEGYTYTPAGDLYPTARDAYRALWESINTAPGVRWDDDPYVWVLKFRVNGV